MDKQVMRDWNHFVPSKAIKLLRCKGGYWIGGENEKNKQKHLRRENNKKTNLFLQHANDKTKANEIELGSCLS